VASTTARAVTVSTGSLVEQIGAEHGVGAAVLGGGQQIDRQVIGQERDSIGALGHAAEQRLLNRPAGGVLDVDDPAGGVPPFAPELEVAGGVAIERDAQLVGQPQDVLGPLARADLDDLALAEPVADPQRVLDVGGHAVVWIERPGHAPLRVGGVGVGGGALGRHHHPAVGRRPQREGQPGQPRPDHQVVGLDHARSLACYDHRRCER
jgi:hypothetical protein